MEKLREAANLKNAQRRVQDVSFVIDEMEKVNAGKLTVAEMKGLEALKGKVDVKHIGMAGHSFGAQTTLAVAGQAFAPLANIHGDPRVAAAVAMSPSPAFWGDQQKAFGNVKIPVFNVTGTADDNPMGLGNVKAADRRKVFDNLPVPPEKYLVIFRGATHMTFAPMKGGETPGKRLRGLMSSRNAGEVPNTSEQEERIHTLVMESTTAFWDAYLKDDATAKTWLRGEFAKELGTAGTLEMK